jgi:hypothetical protein
MESRIMLVPLRKLSVLAGLSTAILAGGLLVSSSASAATATPAAHQAPAAAAASEVLSVPAAHTTITLTAAQGEATMRVVTGAPLATQVIPRGIKCYFPTCGWEFSHAQTVALHAGGVAAAIATCLRFLPGDTVVCAAVGAWLGAHVAPGAHQCLYVSTLPVGVIKYVSC